jgi:hypothetical protein
MRSQPMRRAFGRFPRSDRRQICHVTLKLPLNRDDRPFFGRPRLEPDDARSRFVESVAQSVDHIVMLRQLGYALIILSRQLLDA